MKPLISVVVPIYKVEKYMQKCIDSILAQTYSSLEIILVDDGSPDGCPAMCDMYMKRDQRIRVIHQKNKGLSAARNAGIAAATGQYIGLIDSDDYISPDMYEKLYFALVKNAAEMSICSFCYVNEEGKKLSSNAVESPICDEVLTREQILEKICKRSGASWYYILAMNRLYRADILKKESFKEGKLHEDEYAAHHIYMRCERVACISDSLYYYVQREGSIMHSNDVRHLDAACALYDRYELLHKDYPSLSRFALRASYGIFVSTLLETPYSNWLAYQKEDFFKMISALFRLTDPRAIKALTCYIVHRK